MIYKEVIDGDDVITLHFRDFDWKCGERNFFSEIERMYRTWGYPTGMKVERTIGGETVTWCMAFDDSPDPRSLPKWPKLVEKTVPGG